MIYLVDNRNETDPHINLAIEEFCLRHVSPTRSYIIAYVNRPSVIVGRHQNILQEVDLRFTEQERISVVRRISGGGAVYHDFGNLNYCFINTYDRRSMANVHLTISPVRMALKELGVSANFNPKNDLFVDGRKISGNAQFSNTKRILVHGTLLFDSNLDYLKGALNPHSDHITSVARKSVASEVTNISPYLKTRLGLRDFRGRLLETVANLCGGMKTIRLEPNDWQAIKRLSEEKYRTWDWNYAKAPAFNIHRKGCDAAGQIGYSIDVENGRIAAIRFEKEGQRYVGLTKIEDELVGVSFNRASIAARLIQLEPSVFGDKFTVDNLTDLLAAELGHTRKPVLQIPHHDLF